MSINLGINVIETDGRAAPAIQAAATSVAGFIVRSARGVVQPVRGATGAPVVQVSSWTDFQARFGGYTNDAYGAYAVAGFFANGGTVAYVTRVVNTTEGDTAASLRSAAGPWSLADVGEPGAGGGAAGAVTVEADGAATTIEWTASAAELVGPDAATFDLSGGDGAPATTLVLTVNGSDHAHRFTSGEFADPAAASPAEVAAVLNRYVPGIQAWTEQNVLHVRTDRRGRNATLGASGDAADKLGLTGVPGNGNVGDIAAVTPDEARAVFAKALAGKPVRVTVDAGLLVLTHTTVGSGHILAVRDPGRGAARVFGFAAQAGTSGPAGACVATPAYGDWLDSGLRLMTVTAAYRGVADPGPWGRDLRVRMTVTTDVDTLDLTVLRRRPGTTGDGDRCFTVLESWPGLSRQRGGPRWIEDVLNDEYAGSGFVRVDVADGAVLTVPGGEGVRIDLTQGGDEDSFVDADAENKAFADAVDRFDTVPVQLLCCPESDALVRQGKDHCAKHGDRMFVGHVPKGKDAAGAREFAQPLREDKAYAALYFPWIVVPDPSGRPIPVPPDGHVLGIYARTDRERGVWKAPAGDRAGVAGALDVTYTLSDVQHTDLVRNASVNGIRFIPGKGIVVDSSRTLSTNTLWLYVNVRLLFNFVKSSLRDALRWTVQEPNNSELWGKIVHNAVRPFLLGLWQRGAFGPGAPREVFTVKCDAENNPPAAIQQGRLTVEVYFYPSRPAETIVITVGQQETLSSASES